MAPVRTYDSPLGQTSPIFSYPYDKSREALHVLEKTQPIDAWDGVKLRYINPLTGGAPMPTMATFMQRIPAGFEGLPYRQTDGAIFSVVEGSGSVQIEHNGETVQFDFSPRDHFVIPSWHTARFTSANGCSVTQTVRCIRHWAYTKKKDSPYDRICYPYLRASLCPRGWHRRAFPCPTYLLCRP
jgi:gentisate 1,2-dioxygenase